MTNIAAEDIEIKDSRLGEMIHITPRFQIRSRIQYSSPGSLGRAHYHDYLTLTKTPHNTESSRVGEG